MSHFDSVTLAPADPILSLTEAFKSDPRPDKVNLSVGVFVDDAGRTPVLETVKEAERRLVSSGASKSYLPIAGDAQYAALTQALCCGAAQARALGGRLVTLHTPGGTGALRVVADFLSKNLSPRSVWISSPTWVNHKGIFEAAGMATKTYAYFDQARLSLDYPAFLEAISRIPAGDIVLLHACCHNPTGADLSPEQWDEVARVAGEKGWIALLDFAYQGFGAGIDEDAYAPRAFAKAGLPLFVAQSFSKNFGLYQERVGALHVVSDDPAATSRISSQLKISVRVNYSNPPAHGGHVVKTILSDVALRERWDGEVAEMRARIAQVRDQFVAALAEAGVSRDFDFLRRQKGMFSFTGLNKDQAVELREKHAIYIVDSGRINVAGLTSANLDRVVRTLKSIIG